MPALPDTPLDPRSVLDLARRDRGEAVKALADLELGAQVELVCGIPANQRAGILDLVAAPEDVISRMPPAELCFTVKAIGLESATWLLESATPEQVLACLDLDAWQGTEPDVAKLDAWLEALSEVSDEVLSRDLAALDPELLVLYIAARAAVFQKPNDDDGWQPPVGAHTLEGQFYVVPLRDGDDLAGLLRVFHLLFTSDYWTYFRLLQGTIWELPTENAEWALRWRTGRLQDLGFSDLDEAMGLYRFLSPGERSALPEGTPALDVTEWHLPMWVPSLPEGADSRHLIFRAVSRLDPEERRAAFYAFVAVANQVAVADRLELSDAETTPRAIDKAALWISRGLEHVATDNGAEPESVLRRLPMAHLFRVGANLDPEAARR